MTRHPGLGQRQLSDLTHDELVGMVQDYQECIGDIEELCNMQRLLTRDAVVDGVRAAISQRIHGATVADSKVVTVANGPDLSLISIATIIDSMKPRTRSILRQLNVKTVGDLAKKTETDILEIKGAGGRTVEDIRAMLQSKGTDLASFMFK